MALRFFFLLSVLLALAGCGGDGSSEPASTANTTPVARAGSNRTAAIGSSVTLDGSTSSDADGDALTYAWTLATVPSGSTAALSGASTARPSLMPDIEGVYALTLSVSDGRSTSTAAVNVSVVVPSIVLSQAEPVAGAVTLSLNNDFSGYVTWLIDFDPFGRGASGVGAPITWPAGANRDHYVIARIQTSGTTYRDIVRSVKVLDTEALRAYVTCVSCTVLDDDNGRFVFVDVSAAPALGTTRISALLDGKDVGTLTAPNACARTLCLDPGEPTTVYRFRVDRRVTGSGNHTMRFDVTDGNSATRTLSIPVPISNSPLIALTQPSAEGALVYGSLRVQGATTSDRGTAVTVRARLDNLLFINAIGPGFSGNLYLTGLAPGAHSLVVEADDGSALISEVRLNLVVASSAALAPLPAFTLPEGGQLLAADADELVYATHAGDAWVRNMSSGAQTPLDRARLLGGATDWQFMAGRVYARGKGADCGSPRCIYAWDRTGAVSNLTLLNPFVASTEAGPPLAKAGYVLWANNLNGNPQQAGLTLYDTVSQSYRRIPSPVIGAGSFFVLTSLRTNDLAVIDGVVHVVYDFDAGSGLAYGYEWSTQTGASTLLNPTGTVTTEPKTDGLRVAWSVLQSGMGYDLYSALFSAHGEVDTGTRIATGVLNYSLADGVLAWNEGARNSTAIRVSVDGTTRTFETDAASRIYANGSGVVFYSRQGRLYSWDRATGLSTLRLDAAPDQTLIAGAAVIIRVGASVYRMPLKGTP